ncbi:MAG TPA: hypothetical protein VEB43_10480 [Anaeromyxobacter sp.]|nr:hypothetical protein [Anaeromyxobacter sp.]
MARAVEAIIARLDGHVPAEDPAPDAEAAPDGAAAAEADAAAPEVEVPPLAAVAPEAPGVGAAILAAFAQLAKVVAMAMLVATFPAGIFCVAVGGRWGWRAYGASCLVWLVAGMASVELFALFLVFAAGVPVLRVIQLAGKGGSGRRSSSDGAPWRDRPSSWSSRSSSSSSFGWSSSSSSSGRSSSRSSSGFSGGGGRSSGGGASGSW